MATGTQSQFQNEIVQVDTINAATGTITTLNTTTPAIGGVTLLATGTEINRTCDVSTRMIAGGSSLSVTEAAHDGKLVALDTAAGTTITLPASTGSGARFRFMVTVTATSNSHIIKVASASDTLSGHIFINDADVATVTYFKAAGTDDTITMNRTTTGGVVGDWVEVIDFKANLWFITGVLSCAAGSNPATPYSATV